MGAEPTFQPTVMPTSSPTTQAPTSNPTYEPTASPTTNPTSPPGEPLIELEFLSATLFLEGYPVVKNVLDSKGISKEEFDALVEDNQVELWDANGTQIFIDATTNESDLDWAFPVKLRMWLENFTTGGPVDSLFIALPLFKCFFFFIASASLF